MGTESKEFNLQDPPSDGISQVAFSKQSSNLLAASSWDKTLRLYDTSRNIPLSVEKKEGAALCCCFPSDNLVFSGGLDTSIEVHDFAHSSRVIGQHSLAVSCLQYDTSTSQLFSASWDTTLRAWDTRQESALVTSVQLPGRAYSMALQGIHLLVATSDRHIVLYDCRQLAHPLEQRVSPLQHATRTIAISPLGDTFTVGSIEGRIGVEHLSHEKQSLNFAFKCHRSSSAAHPVHALTYHPHFGTFASGGGDAVVNIWDPQNKKRVCQLSSYASSIASLAFNSNGSQLAIAVSYCFESGDIEHPPDSIIVRNIHEDDVKPKLKSAS